MNETMTPFKMVFSRSIVAPAISMTGHLFATKTDGAILGWLVNTWTERGVIPPLRPRMHWVPKQDGKLHQAVLMLDYGALQPGGEDTDVEPHRAAYIRSTVALWEEEYLAGAASED